MKKYKGSSIVEWTEESIAAFKYCRDVVSNCQELHFLEDTSTPILQTDASDDGIGGYLYMVTNGIIRPIRFYTKSQLNWSAREKERYGIYYGVNYWKSFWTINA